MLNSEKWSSLFPRFYILFHFFILRRLDIWLSHLMSLFNIANVIIKLLLLSVSHQFDWVLLHHFPGLSHVLRHISCFRQHTSYFCQLWKFLVLLPHWFHMVMTATGWSLSNSFTLGALMLVCWILDEEWW